MTSHATAPLSAGDRIETPHLRIAYAAPDLSTLILPTAPRPCGASITTSAAFDEDYRGLFLPKRWSGEGSNYPAEFPAERLKGRAASSSAAKL